MSGLNGLQFHESTVLGFYQRGSSIFLTLDDIPVNGENRSVHLEMQNVSGFLEDGKPSGAPRMVFPDGEVLTLVYKDNVVEIIVEWNDFANHESVVKSYWFLSDIIKSTLDFT